jgi:two-component system OmpR family sensor kinase
MRQVPRSGYSRYIGGRRGMMMIASVHAALAEQSRLSSMEHSRRATAEELVAVVAHDIRNYLAPIELRLEALRRKVVGERQTEADGALITQIAESIGRLRTLVSDLLDVARIDHGLFHVQPSHVSLGELVKESARALSRPDRNVDVRTQATGRILVPGDRE